MEHAVQRHLPFCSDQNCMDFIRNIVSPPSSSILLILFHLSRVHLRPFSVLRWLLMFCLLSLNRWMRPIGCGFDDRCSLGEQNVLNDLIVFRVLQKCDLEETMDSYRLLQSWVLLLILWCFWTLTFQNCVLSSIIWVYTTGQKKPNDLVAHTVFEKQWVIEDWH